VDARSDLYSAGCLLYELLTGRPPFTGDSPVAIAYQHVRENPVPPSRVDPDVPPWADAIVLKAMAKSPDDRYQTAADMRADLQRAASGMPVSAAPPTRLDNYPHTQRMGNSAMMAGTSQIPAVGDYDYAGGDYGRRERGGGGRRWIPWVLGLVLVIGVVAGVAYYLLAAGGKTYAVPLVNGEPLAQAQAQIKAVHLRSTPVNQASATVRKGYVISSNPPEGNNEPANTVVTLYVSNGAAPIPVPNVVNEPETQAETQLQNAGFKVSVNPDPTSTQTAGTVLSQNPPSGGTARPGSTVTITVSGGAVAVPPVVGDSQATASNILTAAGFTVFAQQPSSGNATKGSKVTIFVQQTAATPSATPTQTPTPTGSGGPGL
jgi:serine/threonine-protein kinase